MYLHFYVIVIVGAHAQNKWNKRTRQIHIWNSEHWTKNVWRQITFFTKKQRRAAQKQISDLKKVRSACVENVLLTQTYFGYMCACVWQTKIYQARAFDCNVRNLRNTNEIITTYEAYKLLVSSVRTIYAFLIPEFYKRLVRGCYKFDPIYRFSNFSVLKTSTMLKRIQI